MRKVSFTKNAFEDYNFWALNNTSIFEKLVGLLQATLRDPFKGIGKPEPLKNEFKGCWSRRITDEHRLVYKVSDSEILVIACRYHYEK